MQRTSRESRTIDQERNEKIRRVLEKRGLVGASNDSKWRILVNQMRSRDGWKPPFRYKWVDGFITNWGTDWWGEVPVPLKGVEWLDISLGQQVRRGQLVDPEVINHDAWILPILDEARFCYEVHNGIARIFGYLPKNYDQIDQ